MLKRKKYRLKVKSAIKKRFRILPSGKIKCAFANKRHRAMHKNARTASTKIGMNYLCEVKRIQISKMLGGV